MAVTACKKHPKYQGIRQPRTDCKSCWAYFEGRARAAREQLEAEKKPRRKQPSVKGAEAQMREMPPKAGLDPKKLKLTRDDDGVFNIMYGRRCMFAADKMESVEDFLTGFREGMRFNGRAEEA